MNDAQDKKAYPPVFTPEGNTIQGMSVLHFMQWAKASIDDPPFEGSLTLPMVQRSSLWRPSQVLGLWDSLLEGMPIGCFYLVEQTEPREARSIAGENQSNMVTGRGFELLDGQQRARTLVLGLRKPSIEKRCLWVRFHVAGPMHFELLLTTAAQPFGYKPGTGDKLSFDDRRNARVAFQSSSQNHIRSEDWKSTYDHQLFDVVVAENECDPPRPYLAEKSEAIVDIPMHRLLSQWIKSRKLFVDDKNISDNSKKILEIGLTELSAKFQRIENSHIALILTPQFGDADQTLTLFERIGAGGTPLSNEERLYSIYKHYVPKVHNAVENIRADPKVGHVLPASKIALTAIRIAAPSLDKWRTTVPNHTDLVKAFKDKQSSFNTRLNGLLPTISEESVTRISDTSKIGDAFRLIFSTLRYKAKDDIDDVGVPHLMLSELDENLIQVLVLWAVLRLEQHKLNQLSAEARRDLIRFTLFWHLCCNDGNKASNALFELLFNANESIRSEDLLVTFPGKIFYEEMAEFSYRLMPPEFWPLPVDGAAEGDNAALWQDSAIWRSHNDRFQPKGQDQNDRNKDLMRTWWYSSGKMLLWLQRRTLVAEFGQYEPASGRDDDKPYDLDHFCARAVWMEAIYNHHDCDEGSKVREFATNGRYVLGDAIGNFWWLGSSDNRRIGDASIKTRFDTLATSDAFKEAFGCDNIHLQMWRDAAIEGKKWTSAARKAFQKAVETRTVWLYRRFYDELGFKEWLEPATLWQTSTPPDLTLPHEP